MANIRQRGTNTWEFTVSMGKGPDNKYERRYKTVEVTEKMSPKKLQEYLDFEYAKFKQELETGEYITPGRKTFAEFIVTWRDSYAVSNLSPTTLSVYNGHIESRLIPKFGHMRLEQIKPGLILEFLKELEQPGARKGKDDGVLDFGTIGYIYRVLKNILTRAEEWRMIASNPMSGIKKPAPDATSKKLKQAAQKKNPQYYNEEEAQTVVDALYNETRKWRLFILGSMIGGFRRGELVGLEWSHVSFEDSSVTIENNIPLTQDGQAIEKDPKSLSSIRTVDMPAWYMDELQLFNEEWEQEKGDLKDMWEGEDRRFVFHNGTGKPYYYKHPSRWWERFCERRGIRYIKFHGLRHSMGTLLIEDETEGQIDPLLMAIQKRLGHSRLSTTTDIYVHVTKKVKSRTTGKFDKFARNPIAPAEQPEVAQVDPPRLVRVK
ncbi:tyrosine-type recombinase/integrase [Cohnella yongneupensis]|uniref:Tyrosine-type recombinase/integrase n=1 Tax=Cohnella yongneupensis TaxID=425006 RepID=A0ABW0R6V4_9BACL